MTEESDTEVPAQETPRAPRWRGWLWRLCYVALCIPLLGVLLVALGYVLLAGRNVPLPGRIEREVESQISAQLGGRVDIGSVVVSIGEDGHPRVGLRDLVMNGPDGALLGQFNEVRAKFAPIDIRAPELVAQALDVSGAQLTIRRSTNGDFGLQVGGGSELASADPSTLIEQMDEIFSDGAMSEIESISGEDLTLTLEDARSGRIWQVTDGKIALDNTDEQTSIRMNSEVFNGTEDLAGVELSFSSAKDNKAAVFSVRVTDMPARDIAIQTPALAFLGALDAPVSGALRSVVAGDGSLETFDASLDIGKGALSPAGGGARPVPFEAGRAYMTYDPDQQKIVFQDVFFEGSTVRVQGDGQAYLRDFEGPWPATLEAQIKLTEFVLAAEEMFQEPVVFDTGVADFRLRLDPFTVEFGQVVLSDETQTVLGRGMMTADADGWSGRADLSSAEMTPSRLLALWPITLAPKTRGWLQRNLRGGVMRGVVGALRIAPESRPNVGLTFDIADARVGFLPQMPAVESGWGHFALNDGLLTVQIDRGEIPDGAGGAMQMAGSVFQIEDVFEDPGMARLKIETVSPLASVLRVLDFPPFEVLKNAEFGPDVADATANLSAEARFPLIRDLPVEDVVFEVGGYLENAWSDQLVLGRALTADRLRIDVSPSLLQIEGPVVLDGMPLRAALNQPIGPGSEGALTQVNGEIDISQEALAEFGVALSPGTITGAAKGNLNLSFSKNSAPKFSLTSDLRGAGLSIPAVGFRKAASTAGNLQISGTLGDVPQIDSVVMGAPGLEAQGRIRFDQAGQFAGLDLARIKLGNWLEAPMTINKGGRVAINGGRLDVRQMPDSPSNGDRTTVDLKLDRLVLTNEVTLTDFSSTLTSGAGLNGEFNGRVNGGIRIAGQMVPQRGKTAFRLKGNNAGAVFRDAKLFTSLDGGAYELVLAPRQGIAGFEGQLTIDEAVLGDQSVLIDMLDAVSVVGIIDQLRGAGVLFDKIEGRFRTSDERLVLTSGSAVGASLGISLDGTYNFQRERINMQGVVSPLYLFNVIGSVFTRKGEGLFGFSYRLTGNAKTPRVTVNPLSILTPGMFREIFRRAPPG